MAFVVAAPVASRAEIAFTASALTDLRYRGFSLSDDRPAGSLSFSYDHPTGIYAGATLYAGPTAHDGLQALGYLADVGYAKRVNSDLSWDVGVTHVDLTEYYQPRYRVNYSEVYAGVTYETASLHVYYSPDYLGERSGTLYADLQGSFSPITDWRLFGHAGLLVPMNPTAGSEIHKPQYDVSTGAAYHLANSEIRLTLTNLGPSADYPDNHRQKRTVLTLAYSRFF